MSEKPPDLIAKMDALMGRHRATPAAEDDEIPVLTQVVAARAETTRPAPEPTPAKAVPTQDEMLAVVRAQVRAELAAELPRLAAQIDEVIREVMEQQSAALSQRITERVEQLVRERLLPR